MKKSFIIATGCLIAAGLGGWEWITAGGRAARTGSNDSAIDIAAIRTLTADSNRTTNVVAVGEWSEPVKDAEGYVLRGRLMLFDTPHFTNQFSGGAATEYWGNAPLFLELENLSPRSARSLAVYFALPDGLECEIRDGMGRRLTNNSQFVIEGPIWPMNRQYWAMVPFAGAVRLRVDPQLGELDPKANDLQIELNWHDRWIIPAGDTNTYFLSGDFSPPTNHPAPPGSHAWQGKLRLPPMKITVPKP